MEQIFNLIAREAKAKESFYHKTRCDKQEISHYINKTIDKFHAVDFTIEGEFDRNCLSGELQAKLPDISNRIFKGIFITDIVNICDTFFFLSITKKVKLQVEVVDSDMCRLFHVDNLRQRLVCTYTGPGTEWLENSNVLRDGLGKGINENIVKDFSLVRKAKPFDILILRGAQFGKGVLGAVHRSPPLEDNFQKRILLRLDELE